MTVYQISVASQCVRGQIVNWRERLVYAKINHNKRRLKVNTNKKTAIIVGVLYIIGTVAGILSVAFSGSILNDPDYLVKISADQN